MPAPVQQDCGTLTQRRRVDPKTQGNLIMRVVNAAADVRKLYSTSRGRKRELAVRVWAGRGEVRMIHVVLDPAVEV